MAMFGLQFLTGIMLLVYYVPDTERAFASVTMIMNEVPYGWLLRYLHVVGSNLIMVFLDSNGKYTRLADAKRIRKWIESQEGKAKQASGKSPSHG